MDEINEKNIHQNALKLAEEILHMPMYKPFFNKIQVYKFICMIYH